MILQKLKPLLIVVGLLLTFLLYYRFYHHPMFHEWMNTGDGMPRWFPIDPIIDSHGNFGYPDFDLNLLVIVATDDPTQRTFLTPWSSTSTQATLLPNTPYATTIYSMRDALLIIAPDKSTGQFDLEPQLALSWTKALHGRLTFEEGDLIEEVAKLYKGADRDKMIVFLKKSRLLK
jgi:hypothetical protein